MDATRGFANAHKHPRGARVPAVGECHERQLPPSAAFPSHRRHRIGTLTNPMRPQNQPGAGSREPGAGSREPGAGSREPGAGSREPGAGSREPGAGSREPGAGSREPGAGSREPGAGSRAVRLRGRRSIRMRGAARGISASRTSSPWRRRAPLPAALLLGALALLCATPVAAQNTPVWSATLTVRDVLGQTLGCENGLSGDECSTRLTDDDFTHGGTTYEVETVWLHSGTLFFQLNRAFSDALKRLTLQVGSASFPLRNARFTGVTRNNDLARWRNTGLSWTAGGTVSLSLVAVPSSDANLSAVTAAGSTDGSTFTPVSVSPATGTFAYTASVANGVTHVKLTPRVADTGYATVQVARTSITAGTTFAPVADGTASAAIPLWVGTTRIKVKVTAEDGTTSREYLVGVTRAGTVWSATLTVGAGTHGGSGTAGFGCTTQADCDAKLTDNSFDLGGSTYQFDVIWDGDNGDLFIGYVHPQVAKDADRSLNFCAGATAFPMWGKRTRAFYWSSVNLQWAAGDKISLSLGAYCTAGGTPPAAVVTGLMVTAGAAKLDLSWTAPTVTFTGYEVQYKETAAADQSATTADDPSTGWIARTHTGLGTTHAITGLTNGTPYDVRVRADSGPWATGSGTPAGPSTTGLMVTAGAEKLDLSWTAPTVTFTGYEVQYKETAAADQTATTADDPSTGWVARTHTGLDTTHAITGLTNGTPYDVRVRADSGPWATGSGTPAGPSTLTLSVASATVSEAAGGVAVTATLDRAAGSLGVTVRLVAAAASTASGGGSDYTLPTFFTIASGQTVGTATVTIVNDTTEESDETIVLTATVPAGLTVNGATVTIEDDDGRRVVTSTRRLTVAEGGTAQYTVALRTSPTADVVITPTAAGGIASGEVTISPATLTFTGGAQGTWSTAQTVTVSGAQDADADDETGAIEHPIQTTDTAYGALAATSVAVLVDDDETSADAALRGLTLSAGTLTPPFAAATLTYAATVANSVASVTVTPTANHAAATVTVDGAAVTSGQPSGAIALAAGAPTAIAVVVTAEDGATTRTYTATVTRRAGGTPPSPPPSPATSSDATLRGLTLSAGTLTPPFDAATLTYAATVANSVASVTVTPTANHAAATVTVDGAAVTSGQPSGAIALAAGAPTAIAVAVTAEDGATTRTYTATVTRQPLATLTITPTTVTRRYGEPEPAEFAFEVSGDFADGDDAATTFFTANPLSREDDGTHAAGTYAFVLADPLPYAAGKEHYAFTLAPEVVYTITPRPITAISRVTVVSRTADGTTAATFDTSRAVGAGVLPAEVADFRAGGLVVAGAFPAPDAGTHAVDVTYSLQDSDSFTAGNYALDDGVETATLSGTLAALATLTITPTTVTRGYGEPEPALFAYTVSGPFADGDSADTAFFTTNPLSRADSSNHDAGTYAFVLADPLPYAAGKEHYAFVLAPGVVYEITPRAITAISGVTVVSRAADGTTDAQFDTSRAGGAGVLDAEVADFRDGGLVVSGAFPAADAGTHDVDVTYSLAKSGSFTAGNYALAAGVETATLAGTLTARPTLTITPTTVTRTYGEAEPAVFAYTVSGPFADGDSAATAFFTTNPLSREDSGNHDAGSYGFVLADPLPYAAGKEHYAFVLAPGVVYTITPRAITAISGVTVVSRAADGTTAAAFDTSRAVGAGVLPAEVADFRDGGLVVTGAFPAADAGSHDVDVTYSLEDRGGFKAGNYRLDAGVETATLAGTLTAGGGSGPRLGCKPRPGVPGAGVRDARVLAAGTLAGGTLDAAAAGGGSGRPFALELALPLAENQDGRARPVPVGCVALTAAGQPYDRYAITAGDEQDRFAVDREGMLRYLGAGENHERTPRRLLTVAAATGAGPAALVGVLVEITDADDAGVVPLSTRQPRVGEVVTATLADEDAGVRDARWQWRRRTPDGAWTAIAGATADRYTPVAGDAGNVLRAQVTYADTHGAQQAASEPTEAVALTSRALMLQAGLAGLGRTAAAAATDVIGQRFAPDAPGVDLTLNRRALPVAELGDAAARGRLARTLTEALGVRVTPDGVSYAPASGAELLAGSAFSAQQGHGAGRWGVWGSGDYRHFDGAVDGFTQAGSVLSGWLGADYRFAANALAGLAASYGSLHLDSTSAAHTEGNATLTGWLAHAYPYGLWMPEPWLGFWGIAGLGTGNATLTPTDGGAGTTGDLRAWLGAAGQRVELASGGGLSLAAKADGFVTGLTARGGLPAVDAYAWRARLLLEGGLEWRPPDGRLAALVEVGGRLDGGDAEHGLGVEAGAQVSYTHTGSGLGVSGRGRLLLAHEQGVRDWGAGAALRWQPGGAGAGPALSVAPTWGAPAGGVAALWQQRQVAPARPRGADPPERGRPAWLPDSVALRFGYRLNLAAAGRLTPYAEVGLQASQPAAYRFGLEGSLEY